MYAPTRCTRHMYLCAGMYRTRRVCSMYAQQWHARCNRHMYRCARMHRNCKHTQYADVTCICVQACIVHVVRDQCIRNNCTCDAIVICIGVHVCIVNVGTNTMHTSHVFVCGHVSYMSCVLNVHGTIGHSMQSSYVSVSTHAS